MIQFREMRDLIKFYLEACGRDFGFLLYKPGGLRYGEFRDGIMYLRKAPIL